MLEGAPPGSRVKVELRVGRHYRGPGAPGPALAGTSPMGDVRVPDLDAASWNGCSTKKRTMNKAETGEETAHRGPISRQKWRKKPMDTAGKELPGFSRAAERGAVNALTAVWNYRPAKLASQTAQSAPTRAHAHAMGRLERHAVSWPVRDGRTARKAHSPGQRGGDRRAARPANGAAARACSGWLARSSDSPKRGTCHRDPPQAVLDRFSHPETSRWDFCGEWVEREVAAGVRRGEGV